MRALQDDYSPQNGRLLRLLLLWLGKVPADSGAARVLRVIYSYFHLRRLWSQAPFAYGKELLVADKIGVGYPTE